MAAKTAAQNRMIWALATRLGLDEEALRDVVESCSGQRHISRLGIEGAQQVIDALGGQITERRRKKKRIGKPSDRVNAGQLAYIQDLRRQLGWSIWDLRAWLKSHLHVSHEEWLTNKKATHAITGLRAMRARAQQKATVR